MTDRPAWGTPPPPAPAPAADPEVDRVTRQATAALVVNLLVLFLLLGLVSVPGVFMALRARAQAPADLAAADRSLRWSWLFLAANLLLWLLIAIVGILIAVTVFLGTR